MACVTAGITPGQSAPPKMLERRARDEAVHGDLGGTDVLFAEFNPYSTNWPLRRVPAGG
jgi:hypothetical protein